MFVGDVQQQNRGEALRHARALGVFSSLRIPIVIGESFDRVLTLQWERLISEPSPSIVALARRFADQAGLAIEQAERRRVQEEARLLQAVAEALAAAETPAEVGSAVVRYGIAALGASAGTVYTMAVNEEQLELIADVGYAAESLEQWRTIRLDAETPVTDAARDRAVITCENYEQELERYPWFDRTEESFVAAPLIVANRVIGTMFIGSAEPRTYGQRELGLVIAIARQAAQALDRARLFERVQAARVIAETLQRSFLPETLPSIHGLELAARYLPGTVGVDVGGDWYDAIHLDGNLIGLVVGDVVGKGVRAAATMGQLRNALRAFALDHTDPAAAIGRLSVLVEGMEDAPFATLAYVVVDVRLRRARYIVAGHPPPVLRAPDGTTTFLLSGRALPLGVDSAMAFEAAEILLEPGSTLILYTDGLVERRGRPLDEGLDLLCRSVEACDDDDPEALVEGIVQTMLDDEARDDDVAIVALRLTRTVIDDLRRTLPSGEEGLVAMRSDLRSWLAAARVDSIAAGEIVLASWEACANAVEHAQEPTHQTFTFEARLDDAGRARIEVGDTGQWRSSSGSSERGLGLALMRSFMDDVDLLTGASGTTVVMERALADGMFDPTAEWVGRVDEPTRGP